MAEAGDEKKVDEAIGERWKVAKKKNGRRQETSLDEPYGFLRAASLLLGLFQDEK